MIKYECENCNNLPCDTSICPVCKQRAYMSKSEIYYCENCKTPLYDEMCSLCGRKGVYIGTDIRPVFPEERLLIEVILNCPFEFAGKSVWCTSGSSYYVDGKKIKLSLKEIAYKSDADNIREEIEKNRKRNEEYVDNFYNESHIINFIEANKIRLNNIVTEAHDFIKNASEGYDYDSMFVSFSGGKDSSVTSDLVINALSSPNVIHLYGDTTLEYPETAIYLEKFKKEYPMTPLLVAKNKDQNFNELCKVVGPPSRLMRWCCTIFKTGSLTRKIETTFKNKIKILSFQGLRRSESLARKKYDRESDGAKITKQKVAAPIIDWLDFDVWLYIISKRIPFNPAYRKGFSRVGCWCCPNNGYWSEFLSHIYMNKEYTEFHKILLDFAKQVGKPDPEDYVKSGGWKARQGGNGLDYSKNAVISFKPCALEENTLNFELNKPITDTIYELFKPFGILDFNIGNKRLGEVYVLDRVSRQPILKLKGKIGDDIIKVSIIKIPKNIKNQKYFEIYIKYQITKYQTCLACRACESICKHDAISVRNTEENNSISYRINEKKCVGCLECVFHFQGGCYLKKVLRTKNDGE
ncbi:MAG: phosphoadenosine phosphosulfate reductase family protein [Clostridia bacterium]|nr:phosphoadenosine phosphosulfate reductase family protein [Clostridia bacterium]